MGLLSVCVGLGAIWDFLGRKEEVGFGTTTIATPRRRKDDCDLRDTFTEPSDREPRKEAARIAVRIDVALEEGQWMRTTG